jgi:LAO/AO transport system kinase
MKRQKLDRLKISKTISAIENRDEKALKDLSRFFGSDSLKRTVCFTGPAGVGKSTLISTLMPKAVEKMSVAWLACDPSSPQSGGSLLGDRIRISGKDLSDRAYIRSMSTRGTQAFSQSIRDVEIYCEKFFDQVWVETAGSGQTQSEVAQISAVTVLILQPETGDEIQWMKAGVRELADLYFIHKSDLRGVEAMEHSLMEQGVPLERIVRCSSKTQEGMDEALERLFAFQKSMPWKARKIALHEQLARALFIERGQRGLLKAFEAQKRALIANPYGSSSKSMKS